MNEVECCNRIATFIVWGIFIQFKQHRAIFTHAAAVVVVVLAAADAADAAQVNNTLHRTT